MLARQPPRTNALAKHYTLDATDLEFVFTRRMPANRLGFAASLSLLRHPGLAPSAIWSPPTGLIAYLAEQLGIDPRIFDDYARRPQTVGDFALKIAAALGLRPVSFSAMSRVFAVRECDGRSGGRPRTARPGP